jgi:hypothetical protein
MPVRTPGQVSDVYLGLEHAAQALTAANGTVIVSCLAADAGLLIKWGYQVTTTTNGGTVLSLQTTDYDDASNTTEQDTATIATATPAANTVTERLLSYGNGVAVTKGQHIRLVLKTGGATAGAVRVFAVFRPTG